MHREWKKIEFPNKYYIYEFGNKKPDRQTKMKRGRMEE
jgi:hypothetical protein